jgi:glycosyltransferase involved in cell wall biosynthesis
MNMFTCIHIVPAISPQINDVGDYALSLALHLRRSHGIDSRFIVCDPEWSGPSRVEGFGVRRLRLRTEAGIWGLLASAKEKDSAVLLHYAGYGYDKLGAPLWLYRGIKSWMEEQTGRPGAIQMQFCTVFHELWKSCSKPWKTEFYLRKLQKSMVKGLHARSKLSIACTRRMHQMLEDFEPHKALWLPIPSNVPVTDRSHCGRQRNGRLRAVILGPPEARSAAVKAHANLLRTLEAKGILDCAMLLDTGKNDAGALAEDVCRLQQCVPGGRMEVLGQLNPAEVSRHLSEADLFLSPCSGEIACNSSSFMAALAAGCPAVLRDGENTAPLQENEHFVASDDSRVSVRRFEQIIADGRLDQIATAGRQWYERYADWNVVARKYDEAIRHPALFVGDSLIGRKRANLWEKPLQTAAASAHQTV